MKKSVCFQTSSDGVLHASPEAAKRHAGKRYNAAMESLLRKLRASDEKQKLPAIADIIVGTFIEAHFAEIALLAALHADMSEEPDGDPGDY